MISLSLLLFFASFRSFLLCDPQRSHERLMMGLWGGAAAVTSAGGDLENRTFIQQKHKSYSDWLLLFAYFLWDGKQTRNYFNSINDV